MLTGFQFRVSRAILDLYYEQLASHVGLHFSTLKKLEEDTQNLSHPKCQLSTLINITNFFNKQGISFPNDNIITLNTLKVTASQDSSDKITRFQLKGARVTLKLTQKELGQNINIPQSTLSDLEINYKNEQFIKLDPIITKTTKSFFLQHGVVFLSPTSIKLISNKLI